MQVMMTRVLGSKGRPPEPNRLFFLTLFKRPLTPPPPLVFEHLCCGLYRGLWRQIAPRSKQNLQKKILLQILYTSGRYLAL